MSIFVLGIVPGIMVMKIGKYLVVGDVWGDVYFLSMPKGNVGDIVQRMMKLVAASADQLLNDNQNSVVEIQNHELNEQLALISQLDEDEKNALLILGLINQLTARLKKVQEALPSKNSKK